MGCCYLRCTTYVIAGQYATSHCKPLLVKFTVSGGEADLCRVSSERLHPSNSKQVISLQLQPVPLSFHSLVSLTAGDDNNDVENQQLAYMCILNSKVK